MDVVGGFASLKPGRIHLLCGTCGRKQSNTPRFDDPPDATVALIICDKHTGGKEDYCIYYDAKGNQLPDPNEPEWDDEITLEEIEETRMPKTFQDSER